ncbi:hypothetical protein PIB30_009035 [Stylosanthes scabra]|uniref:Uncharacterized protein n=1 Tax=Stylosanthes scabra TaxID=79078 RepID=A0ABU6U3Z9_9FABA|nr:hypothetical protein [Stylosanthes scabra]
MRSPQEYNVFVVEHVHASSCGFFLFSITDYPGIGENSDNKLPLFQPTALRLCCMYTDNSKEQVSEANMIALSARNRYRVFSLELMAEPQPLNPFGKGD